MDWPGTPTQQQWPGTPAKQSTPQWPGTPVAAQLEDKPPEMKTAEPEAFDPKGFDVPGWIKKEASEGVERIKGAWRRPSGPWDISRGGDVIRGTAGVLTSPLTGLQSAVGKGVEELTGGVFKKADIDTALMGVMAVPGALKMPALPKGTIIEKIFSPTTVSPEAGAAEASIRSAGGKAARDTATTAAEMEPFHRAVNAAPEADRLAFIDHVEGGPSKPTTELEPLAGKLKTAYELRRKKLEALPSTAQTQFIDEYYPHHWQDPKAAASFAENFGRGPGKQGSGASLKARTMPTIADGIKAGLKPVTTDPIEATMRYVASMDRFIASTEVLDAAKSAGTIKYFSPKSMGASGHPGAGHNVSPTGPIPEGWVAIEGRGSTNALGQQAYAPADWARVYNNFISRGFHANEEAGRVYDAVQGASNAITSLELGLSGYHAFTMANESIVSEVARGISQIVGGKPITGLGTIASAPAAPIRTAMRGHKGEQVYLGRTPGTPDFRRLVDLQTEAGGRAVGKSHAADYRYSKMGSYWTAFKRGALKAEMAQSMQNVKSFPMTGAPKEAFKQIGRIMETVAQPIFEKYIPKLKNGAFYDTMQSWIETHPKAGYDEQVAAARQIWDSIDNRFGEMVQDNIFWNKTMKQVAQLGMRSYSWNLGTVREIGGGVKDIASGQWSPRASYVIALPIVVATANATYQYLKTGKAPESVDDLMAGRTGGTAPGFGGRGQVEERAMMPGYQKDVFGWYHDWKQEAANKVATGPSMVGQAFRGKDWRGDPIADPNAEGPAWLGQYFKWVASSLGPISLRQLGKGEKVGSNISTPEMLSGIRPAPGYLQDPEGTKRGMGAMGRRSWRQKGKHDIRSERQYGGPTNAD
jgi:hypothetical protein